MSVNKVIILGRLGSDPELKYTPSGAGVCKLSVATSEKWKDKNSGQNQEKTEWHRVTVFNKTAENCSQYLRKGSQVFLEGKIQTRSWDDNNGQKQYMTEIIANNVQFLDSKRDSDQAQNQGYQNYQNNQKQNNNNNNNNNQFRSPIDSSNDPNNFYSDSPNFAADEIPF